MSSTLRVLVLLIAHLAAPLAVAASGSEEATSFTGHLTVAISYGSAAETLGCSQSEAIVLRPAENLVGHDR